MASGRRRRLLLGLLLLNRRHLTPFTRLSLQNKRGQMLGLGNCWPAPFQTLCKQNTRHNTRGELLNNFRAACFELSALSLCVCSHADSRQGTSSFSRSLAFWIRKALRLISSRERISRRSARASASSCSASCCFVCFCLSRDAGKGILLLLLPSAKNSCTRTSMHHIYVYDTHKHTNSCARNSMDHASHSTANVRPIKDLAIRAGCGKQVGFFEWKGQGKRRTSGSSRECSSSSAARVMDRWRALGIEKTGTLSSAFLLADGEAGADVSGSGGSI